MRIWNISDTHNQHKFLNVPKNIDMVIHGGDSANEKNFAINANESLDFLEWYMALPIQYKVLIGGNHDTAIEKGLVKPRDIPGITYLQHESITIEGIKIFGSPYTPSFGTGWAWNVQRGKLAPYWDDIPEDTGILVTHGPPKGILDLTQYDSREGANGTSFFQCGCAELLDRVKSVQPAYHIFGHIHSEKNCPNSGMLEINNCSTKFINASVVDYGRTTENLKIKQLVNHGFIFDYK